MAPKKGDKEKNQNIQVMVRCRPLNSDERKKGSYSVAEIIPERKEICIKERLNISAPMKTFAFDKVFDSKSKQIDVYRAVCSPIIDEVLTGYNCTVFAYGQTGTGKTYTMEGERSDDPSISWENDPQSGLIPRAMHQLFARLSRQADCEFSVRVSYLEIYNEELIDLLGAESVENPRLRIYEDVSRKGSCVIQGLEEVVVRSKDEVYEILQRGAARRQTAATLMNAHSSRSHCLFMVTIHIKENSVEGEELLKTGKLNLVDLAGSECIGRSGAVDKRAREAGQINQSLLTLGRVISALVEHAPHVPYRESKLTRLLQDSLGGRTKTSIIATISPASSNLEETLSTLDYAHRAKNIQNKPEVNQKLTKKALLKEYNEEIERLRRDLQAARDKNGIFLAQENYDAMNAQIAQQTDRIKELSEQIETTIAEMDKLNELFGETKIELAETKDELAITSKNLVKTKDTLKVTQTNLCRTTRDRDEQKFLVGKHVTTETKLHQQASQLMYTSEEATTDVDALHDKLDRKRKVEETNETVQETFRKKFRENIDSMQRSLTSHTETYLDFVKSSMNHLGEVKSKRASEVSTLSREIEGVVSDITKRVESTITNFTGQTNAAKQSVKQMKDFVIKSRDEELCRQFDFQEQKFEVSMASVDSQLSDINTDLSTLRESVETMISSQKESMSKLVAEQKQYLSKQQELLDQFLQSQTKAHQSQIDHATASLQEQKELNQSLADDFLKNVNKWVHEMMQKQHNRLETNTETCKKHITENKEAVNNFHEEAVRGLRTMTSLSQSNLDVVMAKCNENNTDMQNSIDKLRTEVKGVMKSQAGIQKEVGQFSEETRRLCTERADHFSGLSDAHEEELNKNMNTNIATNKELLEKEEQTLAQMNTQENDQHSALVRSIQDQQASQKEHMIVSKEWSDAMADDLELRDQQVVKFVAEEVVKDIPTGKTPQRREFSFPRTLSKTERHSLLLTEFRKDYIHEEAANLPVADDSFESLASQAPPVLDLDDENVDNKSQGDESQEDEVQNTSSDSAFSQASVASSVTENNQKNLWQNRGRERSNLSSSKNLSESKENVSMRPPSGLPKNRPAAPRSKSSTRTPNKTPASKNPTPSKKTAPAGSKSNTPSAGVPKAKTKLPLRSSNP